MQKNKWRGSWLARAGALLMALAAGVAQAYTNTSDGWNLPTAVTAPGHEVYKMHMWAFWVCVVIGIIVFGAMIWSIIHHRKSKGYKAAHFHESTTVEIIWTFVPFVILVGLAVPAAGALIRMEDVRNADMTVKITGYQWKWQYEYPDAGVMFYSTLSKESNLARQEGLKGSGGPSSLFSAQAWDATFSKAEQERLAKVDGGHYLVNVDHPLVLPIHKKVRLVITGNDVIHAWWVPDIAVKKDAIPGYVNETWVNIETEGTYRGVCAELCGRDHGFMPIVVRAVSEAEFKQWLASQKSGSEQTAAAAPVVATDAAPAPAATEVATAAAEEKPAAPAKAEAAKDLGKDELVKQGEAVYKANCVACHQADGNGLPPAFPSLHGSKVANGPAAAHIAQIINGKNNMPPFKGLSDADIAAVATYERTSWGNKGSVVQPKDVAAARQ